MAGRLADTDHDEWTRENGLPCFNGQDLGVLQELISANPVPGIDITLTRPQRIAIVRLREFLDGYM